jgi:hypothetical protein
MTEIPTTYIEEYEEALTNTPEEVRLFLWSNDFKKIASAIQKFCKLNDEQGAVVADILTDAVIGIMTEENATQRLSAAGINPEVQATIFRLGYTYIMEPALARTEEEAEENEDKNTTDEVVATPESLPTAPSPAEALASIQERMMQAKVVAPTTRNYGIEKPSQTTIPIAPRAVDPYHEQIEE